MSLKRNKYFMMSVFSFGLLLLLWVAYVAIPADEAATGSAIVAASVAESAAGVDTLETGPVAEEVGTIEAGAGQANGDNLLLPAENAAAVEIKRDPNVPELPFADNPDPALCGIPQPWGNDEPAYLSGIYEGELIQPTVALYDSHLRKRVVAQAPHGAEIKIILSQSNPTLNYFMVKVVGAEPPNEGWVPAPFVSFESPPSADSFTSITEPADIVSSTS